MEIGIGLPATIPGATGEQIVEWAMTAEASGFSSGAAHVRHAWAEHGRSEAPRLMALPYFCLGPRAEANAMAFLTDHYAIEGDAATRMAANALTDPGSIQRAVSEYEAAGCDELILYPCSPDPQQVSLLAEVVRTTA
jgi:hypothetical protein